MAALELFERARTEYGEAQQQQQQQQRRRRPIQGATRKRNRVQGTVKRLKHKTLKKKNKTKEKKQIFMRFHEAFAASLGVPKRRSIPVSRDDRNGANEKRNGFGTKETTKVFFVFPNIQTVPSFQSSGIDQDHVTRTATLPIGRQRKWKRRKTG